jgi:hypothetical protein
MIQKKLNLNSSNISYILKIHETLISIYKQEIVRLNSEHPSDKIILEKINNIDFNINKLYNNE